MALTEIHGYAIPHNNGNGGGGNTYIRGGRNSSTYNSINASSVNASSGNIDYLKSKSISANDAEFVYLLTREGTILKLTGNELKYNSGYIGDLNTENINAKKIKTEDLEALNAYIKTLQSYEITTDYLTVTKQAHFFELVIDKIRSVGGIVIITPASCEIDYVRGHIAETDEFVVPTESNYDNIDYFQVFWRATNDDGKNVYNDFEVNDQAICQSLGNIHEGTNNDVSTKYYWRLVTQVGYDNDPNHKQVYVNLSTGDISFDKESTEDNKFEVIMYDTQTKAIDSDEYYYNDIEWEAKAQEFVDSNGNPIGNITTNTKWTNANIASGEAVHGIFSTHSQQYGMYIKPKNSADGLNITSKLSFKITQKLSDNKFIVPDRITIGVYFKDDTYKIWQDVMLDESGNRTLDLDNPDSEIEMIIIMSTADVNWHLCNCMNISNEYTPSLSDDSVPDSTSGCDYVVSKKGSIPERGDNLVQLGYRGTDDAKRQSAIIIAAYHSPDKEITPPSYAQYMGINDFNLSSHRKTYFDADSAKFYGDFTIRSGNSETSIADYITGKISEVDNSKAWKNSKIILINGQTVTITHNNLSSTDFSAYTFNPGFIKFKLLLYDNNGDPYYYRFSVDGNDNKINNKDVGIRLTGYSSTGEVTWSFIGGIFHDIIDDVTVLKLSTSNIHQLVISSTFSLDDLRSVKIELVTYTGYTTVEDVVDSVIINILHEQTVTDGEDGEDGEVFDLVPLKETLQAGLISSIEYAEQNSTSLGPVPLIYDLAYKVNHMYGDDVEQISNWQTAGWSMSIKAYDRNFTEIKKSDNTSLWSGSVSGNTLSFNSTLTNKTNLLEYMRPNSSNTAIEWDYMKCYQNSSYYNLCPSYLQVQLIKNNKVYDTRIINVQIETGAVFRVMDKMIVSAVAEGMTGEVNFGDFLTQDYADNHYTQFIQNANQFQLKAGQNTVVEGTINEGNYKITNIDISPNALESVIGDEYYTKEGVEEYVEQQLGQQKLFKQELDLYTESSIYSNDSLYLVTIDAGSVTNVKENGPMLNLQIDASLNEFEYADSSRPSWGDYSNNTGGVMKNRGVALVCNWSAFCSGHGDWNNNEKNVYVNAYDLKWVRNDENNTQNMKVICGPSPSSGIVQNSGKIIFYLRGGAKYNLRFDWPNLHATLHYGTNSSDKTTINGTNYKHTCSLSELYIPTLDRMWKSQILQEADRISMKVWTGSAQDDLKKTGIDIQKGVIKLTADNTYIDGNLNIQNPDEGLSIYDENNVPKVSILNKTLGNDPTSISNISYVMWRDGIVNAAGQSSFNITGSIDLGAFTSGTNVTLSDFELILSCMVNGVIIDGISSTTTLFSGTISGSHSGTGNISSLNGHSFSGNGNLQKLNFITSGSLNQNASTNGCYIFAKIIGKLTYTSTSGVIIGTDGITSQSSDGSGYAWLTNGKSILYSRNLSDNTQYATLKLEDGKLLRNGGAGTGRQKFGDISSIVNFKVIHNENYYATNDDSMIYIGNSGVGGGNTTNIYLPGGNDSIQGKVFYIKNASTYNVKVYCGDNGKILPANDSSEIDYVDVGNRSHMFICTFQHEYADFYCG